MKKEITLFFLVAVCLCLSMNLSVAQTRFEGMDKNKDGMVSEAEFKGPRKTFIRIDRNRDGYITLREAEGTRLIRRLREKRRYEPLYYPERMAESLYIDTHNHLVAKGRDGVFDFERQAQLALKVMDSVGVKYSLLLPMPQAAGQNLNLHYEDLLSIVNKYPKRFGVLGGGGTLNVMIQKAVQAGEVTEELREEFDSRALELISRGALGFGEMTTEHFSMNKNHPYETAPPDHPLFLRLADLAAEHDLVIDLHMEAIPEPMALPARLASPPNPQKLIPNIVSFERLLAHNRNAKIIWVHLGWCNTGKRTVALTRRLLAKHPNLYMSIRIASGMKQRRVVNPTFPLDEDGNLKKEWLELFLEFPDRFVLGSDEIIKPSGDHPSSGSILSTVGLLNELPPKLKAQIGYENAYRLYNLPI